MSIRVVLADDHLIVREGVQRLLDTQPSIEVVAVCGDLDSLLAAVDAQGPEVVVTDIRMPPDNTDEGIRAAERLRETHPDVGVVVLMDLRLPDIDGADAARRLGNDERTAAIPVVALSALSLEGNEDWLRAAGFAGWIEKPIRVATFAEQVREYCSDATR